MSPVDRGRTDSKRHLTCDGRGTPFKVITTAADANDVTQALALVDGIPPARHRRLRSGPSRQPGSGRECRQPGQGAGGGWSVTRGSPAVRSAAERW
ncbi:transposase [Streptomyces massasporeus]|uniref:transposase n=1 Tax=Streptomyces massasporeus TaxID=67324 RepID=UPI0033A8CDC3